MKLIPKNFVKNGWKYRFIKREGDFVIYEQQGAGRSWFELMRIRSRDGTTFGAVSIAPGEYLPADREWGTHGWTFTTLADAETRMTEMLTVISK